MLHQNNTETMSLAALFRNVQLFVTCKTLNLKCIVVLVIFLQRQRESMIKNEKNTLLSARMSKKE